MSLQRDQYLCICFFTVLISIFFVISHYILAKESNNLLPKSKTLTKIGLKHLDKTIQSIVDKPHFIKVVNGTKTRSYGVFNYRDVESHAQLPWQYDKRFKNPCWYDKDELRCLPYFLIVGIHKCGTTSLCSSIIKHPECVSWGRKEAQFFGWKTHNEGKDKTEDINSYISMFEEGSRKIQMYQDSNNEAKGVNPLVIGDASPGYLYVNTRWREMPGNAGLDEPRYVILDYIHKLLPNAKILVTFRDPVERFYSEFLHSYRKDAKKFNSTEATPELFHTYVKHRITDFKTCTDNHSVRSCVYAPKIFHRVFLAHGIYYVFYEELMRVFLKDQIHIVQMEDLGSRQTMQGVYNFLEMSPASDEVFNAISLAGIRNKRVDILQDVGPMLNKTRDMLYQFYRPYNERMAALTGDRRFLYPYQTRQIYDA